MHYNQKYIFIFLNFLVLSCSSPDTIQYKWQSFPPEDIQIGEIPKVRVPDYIASEPSGSHKSNKSASELLDSAMCLIAKPNKQNQDKLLYYREQISSNLQDSSNYLLFSPDFSEKWFLLNQELFKLSGEIYYAEYIAQMYQAGSLSQEQIKSFAFTRIDDKVYIHLLIDSSASYRHTTGGTIRISQEVMSPLSKKLKIHFHTTDKRFVELFVRIPSSSTHASLEVGGVKYKATSGEYCRVAKMWKTGDVVEVSL